VTVSALGKAAYADEPVGAPSTDPQRGALHPVIRDDDPHDEFSSLRLRVRHDPHWVRAGVEVGSVVVLGFVDYLLNTGARGGLVRAGDERWSLRYSWPELRSKLIGDAFELDGNRMGTNYISHPAAGSLYFHVARSNHLSFVESFGLTILGSSFWEYFGEIRERVSVNDMVVTPVAGAAIGESTMQLSGFFDRGPAQTSNKVLAFPFAPLKSINYWADGAEPERALDVDALGLPREPWHCFEVRTGVAMTRQARTSNASETPAFLDTLFAVETWLANLPGYRGTGRHARIFSDGNVSGLAFQAAVSRGELVDIGFSTRIVPVGFYYRNATLDERGRIRGDGGILGLRLAYEYGEHDFDRDRRRPRDRISVASPVGILAEYVLDRGRFSLKSSLEVGGALAGVQPYALDTSSTEARGSDALPAAVRNDRYYHALGLSTAPAVEVTAGPWSALVRTRLDVFRSVGGLDDGRARMEPGLEPADRRATMHASLAWDWRPVRLMLGMERRQRWGELGAARASRFETSAFAQVV
jgi:hypothetical protein